MRQVGIYLRNQALAETDLSNKDAFGRSAYNRYYYATFLCVKEMLGELDSAWSNMPHKSYPEFLNGTVVATLKKAKIQAKRIDDQEADRLYSKAISLTHDLAKMMKTANAIRVVADYNLEIEVKFFGVDRFALNAIEISSAHSWPSKAIACTSTILSAWRQAHA